MDAQEEKILTEFKKIVASALHTLPPKFAKQIENVEFIVKMWPSNPELESINAHANSLLFGLYSGTPKNHTAYSYKSYPDKITIFAGPIIWISQSHDQLISNIKETVLHEIGHYFGMSEAEIRNAEFKSFGS